MELIPIPGAYIPLTSSTSPTLRAFRSRGRLPLIGGLGRLPDGGGGRPVEPVAEVVGADARHDLVVLDGRGHALLARHDRPRHAAERGGKWLGFSSFIVVNRKIGYQHRLPAHRYSTTFCQMISSYLMS